MAYRIGGRARATPGAITVAGNAGISVISPLNIPVPIPPNPGGGFYPTQLFNLGSPGCFYDFSVRSSLFQDTVGKSQVTNWGQRVGRIRDLSGHGLDLTLASGPGATYIRDQNGYPCLHSDGDSYYTGDDSSLPMGKADCRITVACAFADFDKIAGVLSYGNPSIAHARALILDQSSPQRFCASAWGNVVSGTPPIAGDVYVIQAGFVGGNLSLRVNGIAQGPTISGYSTQSGNIALFGGAAPAALMKGRIYGAIIYGGSAWEQAQIDTWMAALAGKTLPEYDLLLLMNSFSRSTSATWFDPQGVIQGADVNGPRMENDMVTHAPMGLLIEEERTNKVTHSNDFTGSDWTRQNVTITADSEHGPDGLMSASRSVTAEFDGRLPHIYPLSVTLTDPIPNWISVRTWVRLGNYSEGATKPDTYGHSTAGTDPQNRVYVPIAARVVSGPGNVTVDNSQAPVYNLYNLSYDQWTCLETVTIAPIPSAPAYTLTVHNRDPGDGQIGDYLIVWGQQYEFAPFSSSFIPTTNSPATRAADDALADATWAAEGVGCLYGRFTILGLPTAAVGTAIIAAITFENPSGNFIQCSIDDEGNFVVAGRSGGAVFTHLNIPGIVTRQEYGFSIGWAPGFTYASINGAPTVTQSQTHLIPASPQSFYLGSILQQFYLNGMLRKLCYLPYCPDSAELQALSQ